MSFFGGQPASQPATFGTPQQSAPSLFGNNQSSLFGTPASSASLFATPSSSASLFGTPASSAALFGAPASSASLFGTPASSGSLFGTPASSASLFGAPAASGSLFGAPASSASLFGAPAASASLFGAPASSASLFGAPASSSLFGLQPTQPGFAQPAPSSIPAAPPAQAPIPGATRISALPPERQAELFAVEDHLRQQQRKASQLWARRATAESRNADARTRAENTRRRYAKLHAEVQELFAASCALRAAVRKERAAADPVVHAVERPPSMNGHGGLPGLNGGHYGGVGHVPDEYFERIVKELEDRSNEYKGEIEGISEFLRAQGVMLSSRGGGGDGSGGGGGGVMGMNGTGAGAGGGLLVRGTGDSLMGAAADQPGSGMEGRGKTIQEVIRRQYDFFMVVASHVAGVHDGTRELRERIVQLLRLYDRDAADPFEQADMVDKAREDHNRKIAEKPDLPMGGAGGGGVLTARDALAAGRLSGVAGDDFGPPRLLGGVPGLVAPVNPGADGGANGNASRRLSEGRRRRF